jgi:hypothetical protein
MKKIIVLSLIMGVFILAQAQGKRVFRKGQLIKKDKSLIAIAIKTSRSGWDTLPLVLNDSIPSCTQEIWDPNKNALTTISIVVPAGNGLNEYVYTLNRRTLNSWALKVLIVDGRSRKIKKDLDLRGYMWNDNPLYKRLIRLYRDAKTQPLRPPPKQPIPMLKIWRHYLRLPPSRHYPVAGLFYIAIVVQKNTL